MSFETEDDSSSLIDVTSPFDADTALTEIDGTNLALLVRDGAGTFESCCVFELSSF